MSESFDIVIIGGGPGGYVAAIRAAQLGMRVACVENRDRLGGTCLNIGCIPSKALLQSSHLYAMAGHELAQHGVKAGKVELDFTTLMGRKDKVVADFTKGIEFLFRKNKVTWPKGLGRLVGNGKVEILPEPTGGGKGEVVSAKHIIIATGSDVMPLKGVEIDEKQVVTSTGAALAVMLSLASRLMLSFSARTSMSPEAATRRQPMLCTNRRMPRLALASRRLPIDRLVWPVLLRQLKYEDYYLKRELPPTAKPYRGAFHDLDITAAAAE